MIDLAAVLEEAVGESGVVGAQLALAKPGGFSEQAVGLAHASLGSPLDPGNPVQVGSFAKPLLATAALRLAEQGALDLDAPLSAFVPAFAPRDPRARTISARHAMSMSSGLDTGPYLRGGDTDDYLALIADDPLLFAPGDGFAYSGVGVVLLARALELSLGLPWHRIVTELVLTPLALDRTRLDGRGEHVPGHRIDAAGRIHAEHDPGDVPVLGPTGTTAVSTAGELARIGASFAGGPDTLLSPASLAAMHAAVTPVGAGLIADHWGLGVYRRVVGGDPLSPVLLAGHGGRWRDGVCDVAWIPGAATAYAVTTNTPQRAGALIQAVARRMLPELGVEAPARPAPIEVDPAEIAAVVGEYRSPAARFSVVPSEGGIRLRVRRRPRPGTFDAWGETDAALVPIGARRYLPVAEGLDERRLQEIWFSPDGRRVYDGLAAGVRP